MNKKIKLYCIILSVIYISVVVYTIFREVASFSAGFNEGLKDIPRETLHVNLIPKSGGYSFPTSTTNIMDNQEMKMEIQCAKIMVFHPQKLPLPITIMYYAIIFLAFAILICTIWLPFLFFKIIRSASKGNIIDLKVIKRIKKIGIILVFFYVIDVLIYIVETLKAEYLVKLEHYNFFVDFSGFGTLILGIVTLLLAEILSVTLKMKEEQDLTI